MTAMEKKDKNLNVPNLRFPEFSGEWEKCALGGIGTTFNGLTGKSANDFGSGSPFITYKSIFDSSKIDISKVEYVRISETERAKQTQNEVEYGDIFFTTSSETPEEVGMASVLLTPIHDCYLNSFCFGYRLFDKQAYLPDFFRFYLRSNNVRRKIAILAQGSTRFNISKNEVMKMSIFLPSQNEQRKISEFFSLIEERIETQRKIIEKYESLIRGLYQFLFQQAKYDHFVSLGDISQISNGNSDVKDASIYNDGSLYPFFDRSDEIKFLPEYLFDKEAIIYPGEGAEFYPRYYNGKFALHQRCYAVYDISTDFIPRYLYHYCKTQNSYFVRNAVGSTVASLRLDTFKRLKIPAIPTHHQEALVMFLDKIEAKIECNRTILKKYEEQKKYLLFTLFI